MAEHNLIGAKGEVLAVEYLQSKGYEILCCNWRFRKAEIDIIAQLSDVLVIVEVKTRTSTLFENPKEAVTHSKQKLLIQAADAYIHENRISLECRFDIISVLLLSQKTSIEHIEDAFQASL